MSLKYKQGEAEALRGEVSLAKQLLESKLQVYSSDLSSHVLKEINELHDRIACLEWVLGNLSNSSDRMLANFVGEYSGRRTQSAY